ncbi:MAG: GNAT family N-acetyltransferase [Bacteroidota bacterium]
MGITIRQAVEADFATVLDLIKGLAAFQQTPEKVTNSVEQMITDKDLFHCLIAEDESGKMAGIATYFYAYYTWSGKSLYLDDLYVPEAFRGQKAGTMLLDKLFEIARTENCKRVRWQVSGWNEPAILFYKKLGADIDKEVYNCDFDEAAMIACIPMNF